MVLSPRLRAMRKLRVEVNRRFYMSPAKLRHIDNIMLRQKKMMFDREAKRAYIIDSYDPARYSPEKVILKLVAGSKTWLSVWLRVLSPNDLLTFICTYSVVARVFYLYTVKNFDFVDGRYELKSNFSSAMPDFPGYERENVLLVNSLSALSDDDKPYAYLLLLASRNIELVTEWVSKDGEGALRLLAQGVPQDLISTSLDNEIDGELAMMMIGANG